MRGGAINFHFMIVSANSLNDVVMLLRHFDHHAPSGKAPQHSPLADFGGMPLSTVLWLTLGEKPLQKGPWLTLGGKPLAKLLG